MGCDGSSLSFERRRGRRGSGHRAHDRHARVGVGHVRDHGQTASDGQCLLRCSTSRTHEFLHDLLWRRSDAHWIGRGLKARYETGPFSRVLLPSLFLRGESVPSMAFLGSLSDLLTTVDTGRGLHRSGVGFFVDGLVNRCLFFFVTFDTPPYRPRS